MVRSKVITPKLSLAHRSDANLAEFTSQCISNLTENAAAFAGMNPTLAALTQHYTDFTTALESCGRAGNPATTAAKNQAREILCRTLTHCAQSCSEIAGDSIALFQRSGFGMKSKGSRMTEIECPSAINITQGPFEGTVYCSFKSIAGARSYEIRFGKISEKLEGWNMMNTTSGRKCLISDLQSLSRCYLRIRAIGPHGLVSEWSNAVEFKVL
jgi:hypothetical protein